MDNFTIKSAVILAGGRGKRLAPLTDRTPKPMLKVASRPILDYVTAHLTRFGVKNAVFTLGYLPEIVEAHVKNYADLESVCLTEKIPLGTCGAVKNAENFLSENFIVASGDCICDVDLAAMTNFHFRSGAEVTMAAVRVANPTLYGVLECEMSENGDKNGSNGGKIVAFHEKPKDASFGNLVNAGIYIVKKSALKKVKKGAFCDFSLDLFPKILEKGKLYAFIHDGFWSDVGDFASLEKADKIFQNGYFYPFYDQKEVYSLV